MSAMKTSLFLAGLAWAVATPAATFHVDAAAAAGGDGSAAEARFTSPIRNCYTAAIKQESIVWT